MKIEKQFPSTLNICICMYVSAAALLNEMNVFNDRKLEHKRANIIEKKRRTKMTYQILLLTLRSQEERKKKSDNFIF